MKDIRIVGKIGSMAMIRREDSDMDYNTLSRIGAQLRPGMVWVTSGATEIGRLDYIKRAGRELDGDIDECKTDYAAQGQAILMSSYRQFISPEYSVRQLLVEHQHFNDPEKRGAIRALLTRAASQNAIPIVNYNDPVSSEENRKMELSTLRKRGNRVVECVDNDETAAVIATLIESEYLLILSSIEGIYLNPVDPSTLVREVRGATPGALVENIRELQEHCVGVSRAGAGGARAKLEYIIPPAVAGITVIIGHARHGIDKLIDDKVAHTRCYVG